MSGASRDGSSEGPGRGDDANEGGFGLYVHWPFCTSKCPYCDFNSHVGMKGDWSAWTSALTSELVRSARLTEGRVLRSIFFGGGTPSLMEPDLVGALIAEAKRSWRCSNDLEITLEANPGSIEVGRFRGFAESGVDRISIGIQALDDDDLRRLGRTHGVADALRGLEVARSLFDRVSFDLIYGRQDQSLCAWEAELRTALKVAGDHLSLYHLTIEDGTVFGRRNRLGQLHGLPDESLSADLFEMTRDLCGEAGLPAYEVSNHARPGAECRHNLIYWNAGDYVGIGPGAHGRRTSGGRRYATEALALPGRWLAGSADGSAESVAEIGPAAQGIEYLMMGLRTVEGVDLARYSRIGGADLSVPVLTHLEELGLVEHNKNILRVTPAGTLLLDSVLGSLMA